jgi:uncharacterized protein
LKIWIDADACPRAVKEIVYRAAARRQIPAVVVANSNIHTPRSPFLSAVRVGSDPDAADRYIEANAAPEDLAITADIPLAASLVGRGLVVIDPRGEEYSAENVGERRSVRDFMHDLRESGVETGGPRAFGEREARRFAATFDALLSRALARK